MGNPKHLADPFLMVTTTEVADEAELLVDTLLDENKPVGLHGSQITEIVDFHPGQRQRLREAAENGAHDALDALAFADALADAPDLIIQAEQRVRAAIDRQYRETHVENGVRTVTHNGFGSLAPEGVFARACSEDIRDRFADRLLQVSTDTEIGLMTRVGAVEALHNLAPALSDAKVPAVTQALSGLAQQDDVLSGFDRLDADEPLARFKIDMAPPHALRAAAIEALGRVAGRSQDARAALEAAAVVGLGSGAEQLIVAALGALRGHPNLAPTQLDVHTLLQAPQAEIRLNALRLLVGQDSAAGLAAAQMMLADPSPYVRRQLIGLADGLGENGVSLLEGLTHDGDCFIRAAARRLLRQRNEAA